MKEAASNAAVNEPTTWEPAARELDYRSNDGVEVALLWHEATNRLTVSVRDLRAGNAFEFEVGSDHALDAFNHPYAYAAFRGIGYRAATPRVAETVSS
jgi:hypothetical protein